MDKELIGACIKANREKKGLTQAQLAEKIRISENLISNYERGKAVPGRDTLFELSIVLDFSIDALVKGMDYANTTVYPDEVKELLDKLSVSKRKVLLATLRTLANELIEQIEK